VRTTVRFPAEISTHLFAGFNAIGFGKGRGTRHYDRRAAFVDPFFCESGCVASALIAACTEPFIILVFGHTESVFCPRERQRLPLKCLRRNFGGDRNR